MSLKRWLGIAQLQAIREVLKHNGGVTGFFVQWFRMDTVKSGTLVGIDKYGNKYYENNKYFMARNRWVEYNKTVWLDYDASQVPAEWHNWLHYVCDDPPTKNPRVQYKWMSDHRENLSGSYDQYVPYSTTKTKIETWKPDGTKLKIGQAK